MSEKKNIDIVLPCYHPPLNWEDIIDNTVLTLISKIDHSINLHIVIDGDNTLPDDAGKSLLEKDYPVLIHRYKENKGKGFALRHGIGKSTSEYTLITDIDFPYTEDSMVALINQIVADDADIITGYRDEHYYNKIPKSRRRLSKMFRRVNKFLFRLPVEDTQCGLKAFNQNGANVFLKTSINRYLFDLEFLLLSKKNKKLKIKSIPVTLNEGVVFTNMNTSILLQEGINMLKLLWRTV